VFSGVIQHEPFHFSGGADEHVYKYLRDKISRIITRQKEGKVVIAARKDGSGLPAREDIGQALARAAYTHQINPAATLVSTTCGDRDQYAHNAGGYPFSTCLYFHSY